MEACKLDLRNLRGQGYDGASVMSGLKSGVSAPIKELQPRAWFLGGSPKRTAILERHLPDAKQVYYLVGDTDEEKVESNITISNAFSKNLLPKLCETRWSARVDTLSVSLCST